MRRGCRRWVRTARRQDRRQRRGRRCRREWTTVCAAGNPDSRCCTQKQHSANLGVGTTVRWHQSCRVPVAVPPQALRRHDIESRRLVDRTARRSPRKSLRLGALATCGASTTATLATTGVALTPEAAGPFAMRLAASKRSHPSALSRGGGIGGACPYLLARIVVARSGRRKRVSLLVETTIEVWASVYGGESFGARLKLGDIVGATLGQSAAVSTMSPQRRSIPEAVRGRQWTSRRAGSRCSSKHLDQKSYAINGLRKRCSLDFDSRRLHHSTRALRALAHGAARARDIRGEGCPERGPKGRVEGHFSADTRKPSASRRLAQTTRPRDLHSTTRGHEPPPVLP